MKDFLIGITVGPKAVIPKVGGILFVTKHEEPVAYLSEPIIDGGRIFLTDDQSSFHEMRKTRMKTDRLGGHPRKVKYYLDALGLKTMILKIKVRPYVGLDGSLWTYDKALLVSGLYPIDTIFHDRILSGIRFYLHPEEN